MATHKWLAAEAATSALTTALDGLGNGSYSAASSAIANQTGLYPYMALELYLASLTPTAGGYVAVYLVPAIDGTNYEDGGGAVAPPAGSLIATFDLSTSASTKRRARTGILIPPYSFELILLNASGVALAANGNTLKYSRYYDQVL